MFSIDIRSNVYRQWQIYTDWNPFDNISFTQYCVDRYPEVLGIRGDSDGSWEFVFESEDHYNWFLLKVM